MYKADRWIIFLVGLVMVLFMGACQQSEAPVNAPFEETSHPTQVAALAPDTVGGYYDRALAGEFAGRTVFIAGMGSEEDAAKFLASIAEFEDQAGIDIQYEGSMAFLESLEERSQSAEMPDIVDFPQPGNVAGYVTAGQVVNLLEYMDLAYLQEQYDPSWLDMATFETPDGPVMAGVWHHYNIKSLVWYPREEFEAAGYEIPTTWAELIALSDQMVTEGHTPWCVGIEGGPATGWVATDWMEEIMLRTTSLENYDAWVQGELPFQSEEVRHAAEMMSEIFLNEAYVNGGRAGLISAPALYAIMPMFEDPPACWLYRQGNFVTSFFPPGLKAGYDYDFFYFPPIESASGKPFLVGGDLMVQFNDRPEVRAVMEYFSRAESMKSWMEMGGTLSPHRDAQLEWYGDPVERDIAALTAQATSFRFDGSDLMPGEVGSGSFWTEMTDYLSGAIDLQTALENIDSSWPP